MAPKPTRNPVRWQVRAADAPSHAWVRGERVALGRIEFVMADGEAVPAGFLRYSERDAWSLVFPTVPYPSTWEAARSALVEFDPGSDYAITDDDDEGADDAPREVPPVTKQETESADEADSLAASIAAMIRDASKPAIDSETIRQMIQDELANMPKPVVQVIREDRPTIEIEGATHHLLPKVLKAVDRGMKVYLPGPPGTGKTTLAEQVAHGLGLEFGTLACHPQMTGVSLFGYMDAQGRYVSTTFRRIYEFGGVFLLDEADNGNGGIIAALNQAMENGHCDFPDGPIKRHPDFRIIIAANTFGTGATAEFAGRNKLDAATLNRFVYVPVEIDEAVEEAMVLAECDPADAKQVERAVSWLAKVRQCRENANNANLNPKRFITPRDARDGAALLAMGWTMKEAAEAKFLASCDATARERITQGVRF